MVAGWVGVLAVWAAQDAFVSYIGGHATTLRQQPSPPHFVVLATSQIDGQPVKIRNYYYYYYYYYYLLLLCSNPRSHNAHSSGITTSHHIDLAVAKGQIPLS